MNKKTDYLLQFRRQLAMQEILRLTSEFFVEKDSRKIRDAIDHHGVVNNDHMPDYESLFNVLNREKLCKFSDCMKIMGILQENEPVFRALKDRYPEQMELISDLSAAAEFGCPGFDTLMNAAIKGCYRNKRTMSNKMFLISALNKVRNAWDHSFLEDANDIPKSVGMDAGQIIPRLILGGIISKAERGCYHVGLDDAPKRGVDAVVGPCKDRREMTLGDGSAVATVRWLLKYTTSENDPKASDFANAPTILIKPTSFGEIAVRELAEVLKSGKRCNARVKAEMPPTDEGPITYERYRNIQRILDSLGDKIIRDDLLEDEIRDKIDYFLQDDQGDDFTKQVICSSYFPSPFFDNMATVVQKYDMEGSPSDSEIREIQSLHTMPSSNMAEDKFSVAMNDIGMERLDEAIGIMPDCETSSSSNNDDGVSKAMDEANTSVAPEKPSDVPAVKTADNLPSLDEIVECFLRQEIPQASEDELKERVADMVARLQAK